MHFHYNLYYITHLHLHYTLCNKIDIDPKDPNSNFARLISFLKQDFSIKQRKKECRKVL
jgi:hypothetical protein